MATKIQFGTDGWRGVIAEDYTFDNVKRCAQGFAAYLDIKNKQGGWVIVGYDKRFASENFAMSAASVLAGNGYKVYLTDTATPTPVIAYAVVNKKAAGAINITASHNPPSDNGFKVRNEFGGAIDPKGLKFIEANIPESILQVKIESPDQALSSGHIVLFNAATDYIEHIHHLVDIDKIRNAGLNIVVDAMWGNGGDWFTRILSGAKTKVFEIHNTRNPSYPEMKRPEPIPPNINVGLQTTVDRHADVLLITDGDADRVGLGDENGVFINQLQAYALLALYLLEIRKQTGTIVKTLSTTSMLDKLGKIYNVPIIETGVGFKYVAPKMLETNAMMGGEESGGYAFRGNVPERDGILAGLFFLDFMVSTKKKPSELLKMLFDKVGPHYYDRIDTSFSGNRIEREKAIIANNPKTIAGMKVLGLNQTDGFKFLLEDGGWMLIRFSGTEPIIRVYCETTQKDKVQDILKAGLKTAGIE
jgi:alpha-D-glucose phosphate-specific phosphoglucomutase